MIKKFMTGAAVICVSMPAFAGSLSAEELSVSASVDYVTQYVFRGVGLAEEAVQPGVELGYGGLYAGVWHSDPLSQDYSEETDFYVGFGFEIDEGLTGDVGLTHYSYPGDDSNTTELFGGLSFDVPVSPTLYAYWDLDLQALTVEGTISSAYPLNDLTSLDFGASIGTVRYDDTEADEYTYGTVGLSLSRTLSDNISGYAGVNVGLSSEKTYIRDDDFKTNGIWAGFGVSFSG